MVRVQRTCGECLNLLRASGSDENRKGMQRFGINIDQAFGVSMPDIRQVGKTTLQDHDLALELWASGFHEARILAGLVDKPAWVTADQMNSWVVDFNSWDVCDQICGNLFDRTPFVHEKIFEWSFREEEFVKRAAFALIAWRAVHDKKEPHSKFLDYLPLIEREATDARNFVKKAVNWALRQIGKRARELHGPALALSEKLAANGDATERWIGRDAVKELSNEKLKIRLGIT